VRPGASVGYVQATRTSLPRWAGTGGAGRLAPRALRTARAGYAYQPRAFGTYRAPWHPRRYASDGSFDGRWDEDDEDLSGFIAAAHDERGLQLEQLSWELPTAAARMGGEREISIIQVSGDRDQQSQRGRR